MAGGTQHADDVGGSRHDLGYDRSRGEVYDGSGAAPRRVDIGVRDGKIVALEANLAGEATHHPIGTGPFRFVSYAPADRVVLERNPMYFRAGLPGVNRLVFRILSNAATAVAALEKGEVDYVGSVAGPEVERLRQTPGIAVVSGTGGSGGASVAVIGRLHFSHSDYPAGAAVLSSLFRELFPLAPPNSPPSR